MENNDKLATSTEGENGTQSGRSPEHTPGPWHVERGAGGSLRILDQQVDRRLSGVAQINSWPGKNVTEANARLIAAAPEMLEHLRKLQEAELQYQHVCIGGSLPLMDAAEAAVKNLIRDIPRVIAKAEVQS